MARKAKNEEMAVILERMLKQYGLTVGLDKVNVKDIYKSVVGDYIFNQTKSIQLRKKVLFINLTLRISTLKQIKGNKVKNNV